MTGLCDGIKFNDPIGFNLHVQFNGQVSRVRFNDPIAFNAAIEFNGCQQTEITEVNTSTGDPEWFIWELEKIRRRRKREAHQRDESQAAAAIEAAYEAAISTDAPPAWEVVEEIRETVKPFTTSINSIDFEALAANQKALNEFIDLFQLYKRKLAAERDEEEAILLLLF